MKGLTLTQPWATLVAIGAKRIETRGWSTAYRGELVIHAGKKFPAECRALCYREPFLSVLVAAGFNTPADLPTSAVVAVATLRDVLHTESILQIGTLGSQEWAFGDYSPHRFGFILDQVKRAPHAVPCRGALSLWSVPQIAVDMLAGQGLL